ncbi:hypothetical protein TPHA_0A03540 [Tetrapisispora phaffii CBS 4417]|uniref:Uncharacterized protein n=1 Tax=Tetrapisispora phaffii (strain ATCC 24235 / CBS 4417 / NBRC 1672 / NRRL Y-8282 / UCD 70-5) TaxID=1071381 RepID=G8BNF2_TETPH|nr:hypothetical protein TPHA_0A03540 [Tetrapisispora phaffii CBS 4417]CCE61430.1 hypothetical protein TPHA_0A03540 [Tetrapisispora phaffii CBS 4417]
MAKVDINGTGLPPRPTSWRLGIVALILLINIISIYYINGASNFRFANERKDGVLLHSMERVPLETNPSDELAVLDTPTADYTPVLFKRSWRADIIDGAVSTFSDIVTGANLIYSGGCTSTFVALLGVTLPGIGGAALGTCLWVGSLLAAANFVSYTLLKHGNNGGWEYDSDSATAHKRSFDERNLLGLPGYRHIIGPLYTQISGDTDGHSERMLRDISHEHANRVLSSSGLFSNATGALMHIGYQFILNHDTYNTTVITDIAGHADAINTYLTCLPGEYCYSVSNTNNNTLTKRDDNGFWLSYNDWGDNLGYAADWASWGEFTKAAQEYQGQDVLGAIQQIQPCTQQQCYGIYNKFCFAGGLSATRGENSAFVGEVYYTAFGGVDGDCYNG